MKQESTKEFYDLLFEFITLYHHKVGAIFHHDHKMEPHCNKNQVKAMFIIEKKGKITPTELGNCLDLRKGSLTTLVDSLEEMNLVRRQVDSLDRRKQWISLTEEGEKYLGLKRQAHEKNFAQLFAAIREEEIAAGVENLKQLIALMQKM